MSARRLRVASIFAGFVSLAGGVALLATILFQVPLVTSVAIGGGVVIGLIVVLVTRSNDAIRRHVGRLLRTGLIAGIVATLAYDISKAVLSVADPTPFNPFEAIRIFGILLVGEGASPALIWTAGTAFHIFNGVSFAVAYAQLLSPYAMRSVRWALGIGMLWGLFLEIFQLTLYPGWLSIGFLAEFQTISFSAHLIYGATLGLIVYRRLWRSPPAAVA